MVCLPIMLSGPASDQPLPCGRPARANPGPRWGQFHRHLAAREELVAGRARHDEGMDPLPGTAEGVDDMGFRALVVDDEAALADVVARATCVVSTSR